MHSILKERNITDLYHFTQADNLENILKYGLLPRACLVENAIDSVFNDDYRLDGCCDAVCTSLEFPNYKMFYTLRENDHNIDWVVIKLDADIICDMPCAFCWENAASSSESSKSINIRNTGEAFLSLFDNKPGYPTRQQCCIPDYYPTNPQAEILVFSDIPVKHFKGIYFEDNSAFMKYRHMITNSIPCSVNSRLFFGRQDWKIWQNI